MNKYKLFANMGYKAVDGLRQICIVVDERFGYVGITDSQWEELKKLQEQVYSKPIDELLPPERFEKEKDSLFYSKKIRDENIAILKTNRINNIWVHIEYDKNYNYNDGHKIIGFSLIPHSLGEKAGDKSHIIK